MQRLKCPSCRSSDLEAAVRVCYRYGVLGLAGPGSVAYGPVLLLNGKREHVESEIDEELHCKDCGHCFDVPKTVQQFRRGNGPLEDANL